MVLLLVFITGAELLIGLLFLGVAIANRQRPNRYRVITAISVGIAIYTSGTILTPFWHRGWPAVQTIMTAGTVAFIIAFSRGRRSAVAVGSVLILGCTSFGIAWSLISTNHIEWFRGQQMYNAAICRNIESEVEELVKRAPPSLRNKGFPAGKLPAPLLDWMCKKNKILAAGQLKVSVPVRAWYTEITGLYMLRPATLEIFYSGGKPSGQPRVSVRIAKRK